MILPDDARHERRKVECIALGQMVGALVGKMPANKPQEIWEAAMIFPNKRMTVAIICGSITIAADSATPQPKYGPGVTDTEIKIGTPCPTAGRSLRSAPGAIVPDTWPE